MNIKIIENIKLVPFREVKQGQFFIKNSDFRICSKNVFSLKIYEVNHNNTYTYQNGRVVMVTKTADDVMVYILEPQEIVFNIVSPD